LRSRYKISVEGVVQGVGFRPFVYKLATELNLFGWVLNDSRGVFIDIEGDSEKLEKFLHLLKTTPPKNSIIEHILSEKSDKLLNRDSFIIKESLLLENNCSILPSDKAICPECQKEIKNPKNRRFKYIFTNCIDCGPRYSIIKKLPYDRARTSMASFVMCPVCEKEYKNPLDRRYHAQPNSCSKCGPELAIYRNNGTLLAQDYKAIEVASKLLKKGHILAIKGLGGFHLVCDATKGYLIQKLRDRKMRPHKPFAVMFRTINDISKCTELTPLEEELILSSERPIVLLNKKKPHRLDKFCISCDGIAPNLNTMGVFLPYTPLHILLFDLIKTPLVVTSANISGEPLITDRRDLEERLGEVYDYVIDYNREIVNPVDDSVVTLQDGKVQMVRRARGYAPVNIKLPFRLKKNVLALGARQKNSIAIAFEDNCILSPYIGDLDNVRTQEVFKKSIETFLGFYNFTPELILLDMHPHFEYRDWAEKRGIELKEVQHHQAHLLALALEKKELDNTFLGIAFDGSGYGGDGNIWGGEFFIYEDSEFKRVAHFREFLLLGGDKATKEPKRVAFSILYEIYGDGLFELEIPLLREMKSLEIETFKKMYDSKLNSFYTTSVGRIFDGVAALAIELYRSTYEGEAGMRLEALYEDGCMDRYSYKIEDGVIDIREMFIEIIKEDEMGSVATKFINTLAHIILDIAKIHNKIVLLSGGVFQNRALSTKVGNLLREHNISYHIHEILPPNDGCIAVGQVASMYKKGE